MHVNVAKLLIDFANFAPKISCHANVPWLIKKKKDDE